MRKYLSIIVAFFAATALALGGALTASAADWSANGESAIVDATTAKLQGDNTSVETGNLGINVDAGATVSFDYQLNDGALCESGAPRAFVVVNGTLSKSDDCDGSGSDSESGTISFTVSNAGLVTQAGLVYDAGRPGHVLISNLTVGGQQVSFLPSAEPEPEPTDPADNGNGNGDTDEPTDPADKGDDKPNGAGGNGTTKPNGSVPVPTTVPAGVGTLPETGPTGTALVLLGLLGAVLVAGGGLLAWQQQRPRPGRYRA